MSSKTKSADSSAIRCTRSSVAPEWTHTQTLILVNEIAAIEADCLDALSYYQKWKMIADNCAALEVNRTLDQCRRKWDSLFADYNAIKKWESENCGGDLGYWSFGAEERRNVGLPEVFERELFDAVDDVVKAQVERAALHPDAVMEDADADPLGVIAPPVLRRQSHQLTPQKRQIEAKSEKKVASDKETGSMEFMAPSLRKNAGTMQVIATQPREKADSANLLSAKLKEQAEMVWAILEGMLAKNEDMTLNDLRKGLSSHINLARRQGDKLIDCFSVIASTLDQMCKVAPHPH